MRDSDLHINIARLREVGLDLHLHLDEDWFANWQLEDPDLEFSGPREIEVQVHLERHVLDILVRGHLEGALQVSCSRCLTSFSQPVASDFDLLLAPGPKQVGKEEEELSKADLDVDFYSGEIVNLENILREQILLALPLKPLCAEACQGICPRCGADLNQETCECAAEDSDSPFAMLKKIKV